MDLRFPRPLAPGDIVGITSPSSGVSAHLQPRLDVALRTVEAAGLRVRVGMCMNGDRHVSAPADERAAELQAMLVDPDVRAIVPPWGGETAIDLVDLLDWDAIGAAEPTWMVGFSDISTLITPLTLRTGWATIHGQNLMDTPYRAPDGLSDWLRIVRMGPGTSFTQVSPGAHRRGFVDYIEHPDADEYVLDVPSRWSRLDGGEDRLDVRGRLIGGCIETLANLAGTPYLDVRPLAALGDPLIVYVEAACDDAPTICRNLHGMRLAGFFDDAIAVLLGRTYAPDGPTLTQQEAALDALGPLGIPLLAGVDCGHWAPYLPLVNGALCHVEHSAQTSKITQTLS